MSKTHAMPAPIAIDVTADAAVELVGILRGDVDGSWVPPDS